MNKLSIEEYTEKGEKTLRVFSDAKWLMKSGHFSVID